MTDVLVVSGGQAPPVLDLLKPRSTTLSAVAVGVEVDWSTAVGATPLAVVDLVVGLGDHCGDAAEAQLLAVGSGRVRLVAQQRERPARVPCGCTRTACVISVSRS
jgi:hypothetical protein